MAKEVIAKCPVCGGDVVETQKAFSCSNWREEDGGCKFTIWKSYCDKKITKSMAKSLIEKGKTAKIKGFVSKRTGKEFDAALKLEKQEDGTYRVVFDFGE